jgi:hypothetical protein
MTTAKALRKPRPVEVRLSALSAGPQSGSNRTILQDIKTKDSLFVVHGCCHHRPLVFSLACEFDFVRRQVLLISLIYLPQSQDGVQNVDEAAQ